jgi:hypothetical protein
MEFIPSKARLCEQVQLPRTKRRRRRRQLLYQNDRKYKDDIDDDDEDDDEGLKNSNVSNLGAIYNVENLKKEQS